MRTVFVTGAGSGIGRATAQRIGNEPDTAVVCIDLDEQAAQATASSLQHGLGAGADVSDERQCLAAVRQGIDAFGSPSGLVHCAAIFGWHEIDEITEDFLNTNLGVNVNGTFFMARAVAKAMIDANSTGSIVLFSSGASRVGLGAPVYSASKGAVESLMRELAVSWAPKGLRVNAVLPGVVVTPMSHVARTDSGVREAMLNHIPMKRFAEPEELAEVAAFLVSDRSSYVTGVCLPVDGGFLAV